MSEVQENKFVFLGEVVEVFYSGEARKIKVVCKPGHLLIEAPGKNAITIGDEVVITGNILIDKIDNFNRS